MEFSLAILCFAAVVASASPGERCDDELCQNESPLSGISFSQIEQRILHRGRQEEEDVEEEQLQEEEEEEKEEVPLHSLLDEMGDALVPSGTTALVSQSVRVQKVTIERGGTLRFEDVEGGVELSTTGIEVEGKLEMGSERRPLVRGATVTLRGENGSEKGILIRDGAQWEAHGQAFTPTWSRLASQAAKLTKTLVLQEEVNWLPGQKLLVVTTVFRDEEHNHQNEVVTVDSVRGKVVTLVEPLVHNHYGGPEYFGEVALLSRSITIQGDQQSEGSRYGGHTRCHKGSQCRLSYVRAHRMGQLNKMGRYPFHLHMMGSVDDGSSYFEGLTVERSYFRAMTIHGTSSVRVSRCVAFDVLGNAMYLEDGSEELNVIERNLVAHVKPIKSFTTFQTGIDIGTYYTEPDRIVPTDIVASAFYCTNPNNRWIGNVASGGQVGFVFPALPRVLGVSSTLTQYRHVEPMKLDVLQFHGNTAHSAGWWWDTGSCSYFGGLLENPDRTRYHDYKYIPGRVNSVRGKGVLNATTYYACRHGFVIWGNIRVNRPQTRVVDNTVWDTMTGFRMLGHNMVEGGLLGARSGNADVFEEGENWELAANPWGPSGKRTDTGIVGMTLYDTAAQTMISGTTFRGFRGPGDVVFHSPTKFKDFIPSGQSTFFGLRFEDTEYARHLVLNRGKDCFVPCHASQYSNVMDHDGSLTSLFGGAVLGASDLVNANCKRSCGTKDWWKLDASCQKVFDGWGGTASGGWWACPTASPNSWARTRRFISTIVLVSGDPLKSKAPSSYTTDQGTTLMDSALKHSNFKADASPVPGTIFHFGTTHRQVEIGFDALAQSVQVTGACCDVGWYFVPSGGAPSKLHILLEQADKEHGLIFAIAFPAKASLKVMRKYRFGADEVSENIAKANNKKEFLESPGSKIFVEKTAAAKLLFLKLTNGRGTRFQGFPPFDGNWEVSNGFEDQPRYSIIDKEGGGPVADPLSLRPLADWMRA
eukprot:TRINITY_DN4332_c0_g1_i1.p1 TRINITY_DN4332_c0_g1~~TRINITY_DN4332_c0_g1_i1.p1  ORF type:complete len:1014 (+),score=208.48 TRINITY_DN4332_c0_g1_i1:92-3043(+)